MPRESDNKLDISGFVDPIDFAEANQYNWYKTNRGYARAWINKEKVSLHRFIAGRMGLSLKGIDIDHIDRDRLNCHRSNLRAVSKTQNAVNRRSPRYGEHKGVSYHNGRWQAQIRFNYNLKYLGRFASKEEAIEAYKKASIEYFGVYKP